MATTVIDATSGNWSLVGNVQRTTRAAIAQWCPPAAGTEDDPILLTGGETGALPMPQLRFQAAAIIVYGAIMGDLEGNIAVSFDGAASSNSLPAADIAAAEFRSAAGDAACGLVLARRNNMNPDTIQVFEMNPMGRLDIAIYRVELFDEPIQTTTSTTTRTRTASLTDNGSGSKTTSSETGGPASSIGTIKAPPSSSPSMMVIIIPSIVGTLLLIALIAFLVWRRRRRATRRHPTIDTYDPAYDISYASSTAPPSPKPFVGGGEKALLMSAGNATHGTSPTLYVTPSPSTGTYDTPTSRTDEKVRLLHVADRKSWRGGQSSPSGSGATSPGSSTPSPAVGLLDLDGRQPPIGSIAPVAGVGASVTGQPTEDVVQMQALSEAMQRAGFSPAALLESLNRVHARADDVDNDIVEGVPTNARTQPPQYQE